MAALAWLGPGVLAKADEPTRTDRDEAHRRHVLDPTSSLASRIEATPASVLDLFKQADRRSPEIHALADPERRQLGAAIDSFPALHRKVLRERLRVISFLDGMPNTALTSVVNPDEPYALFDITINAAILRQDVSDWLTRKERSCFDASGSMMSVSVEAGKLDALVYVLLHEATHVVDASLKLTPMIPDEGQPGGVKPVPTAFTDGVWSELSVPTPRYRDPIRDRVRFYEAGGVIPVDRAGEVYDSLRRTPFVSLYGARNWLDDLAEYVTVFHLTETLKQPFRIVIRKGGEEVFGYEPMKADLVRGRVGLMDQFYRMGP